MQCFAITNSVAASALTHSLQIPSRFYKTPVLSFSLQILGKFSPMKLKSEAGYTLREYIQDVGIPQSIHTNGAKELTLGNWKQVCRDAGLGPIPPWCFGTFVANTPLN